MDEVNPELFERYLLALRRYGEGRATESLQVGYEVGQGLLAAGSGLGAVVSVHHRALAVLAGEGLLAGSASALLLAADELLAEALSPFESTHRRQSESNSALRRLNEVLDQQAKRIAHALHDEAGQLLATVHIALSELERDQPGPIAPRIRDVRRLLDRIEEELRQLSHELRPTILDDLGLVAALEFLAQAAGKRTGIEVVVDGAAAGRLPQNVEVALYRIVQEGLTNVCRHANAKRASIQLRREGQLLHCSIVDDGKGCDAGGVVAARGARGFGLIGIRERLDALGGSLVWNSVPGGGTSLFVTIPLDARHAA